MRAALNVLVLIAAACSGQKSTPTTGAPSPAPAKEATDEHGALALRLVAAARPCNVAQVTALLDREGFVKLIEQRASAKKDAVRFLEQFVSTASNKFCAWVAGAVEVRMLRVRSVDGERRPLLRKVSDTGFGYFDVRAAPTADGLRIVDIYSHNNGTWISQEMADIVLSPAADDPTAGITVMRINALDTEGKHADALAALDAMPERVRNTRELQDLRVAIAGRASVAAYEQALAERARLFPDDKPTPMSAMNRAFLAGDLTEALHQIDLMEAAVGGDQFLDALRASVLAQRKGPGDLDAAASRAERAVQAEPKLAMTHQARLIVALARRQWTTALSALDSMQSLGVTVSDADLRAIPSAADLLASPEYAEWRKRHP